VRARVGSIGAARARVDALGMSSNAAEWGDAEIAKLTAGKGGLTAEQIAQFKANPDLLNTSIGAGSRFRAYFNPSNWFRGSEGVANAETIADMNARANIMTFRNNGMLAGTFSGVYGLQNHVPWVSINPSTGKPYGFVDSLESTGIDAGTGFVTGGSLPFLF